MKWYSQETTCSAQFEDGEEDEVVQVHNLYPVSDSQPEHEMHPGCWCEPEIEEGEDGSLITIHKMVN